MIDRCITFLSGRSKICISNGSDTANVLDIFILAGNKCSSEHFKFYKKENGIFSVAVEECQVSIYYLYFF